MRAMVLESPKKPLIKKELPIPIPTGNQVLIKIAACAICRTDLHIINGELPAPKLPLILGHQIVGTVVQGPKYLDQRVGVPWLGKSCGMCDYCRSNRENLCDNSLFTGYQIDGGFAEYCVADADFIFPLPIHFTDIHAAPLLCGGMIGYRALSFAENAQRIGFFGYGSSAHLLMQIALEQGKEVFVFTRTGDAEGQKKALEHGATWAGSSDQTPPAQLDAVILFAPVGALVPQGLKTIRKGGVVICAGIHMSDIPSFPYQILWEERRIQSVANLTREDGHHLLALANEIPLKTEIKVYPLEEANQALEHLEKGMIEGTGVLKINL